METHRIDLAIEGMTCASCVARVQRRLERLDGVEASVNLATERARVVFPPTVDPADLVAAVTAAGYTARPVERPAAAEPTRASEHEGLAREHPEHPEHPERSRPSLTRRFVVAAALTVPIVALAMIPALQFVGWPWASLVLAAPVVCWAGWPFHRAAWRNLRHGSLTMDTLVSLGTLTAFCWSLWTLIAGGGAGATAAMGSGGGGEVYFEVSAVIVTAVLLGRVIEARSKRAAGAALTALAVLAPSEVTVIRAGAGGVPVEVRIPARELRAGDRFSAKPGERLAADGVVREGEASVDESMLTGESVPIEVAPGSRVTGATIVHGGRLLVEATRVGADSRLAQIARLVEDAQLGSSRAQRLADRVSAVFVPVVILIALGTLAAWLATGSPLEDSLTAAVAVLVIACPCALGLATPMAVLVGTGRGAARGILITGPEALDRTAEVDSVLLDKTGTLTTGRMRVARVVVAPQGDDRPAQEQQDRALTIAAALERGSEHPIAHAVVAAAGERAGRPEVQGFRARAGFGVHGVVDGVDAAAGRVGFLRDLGYRMPQELADRIEAAERTVVAVGWDGAVRALLELEDTVRPGSRDAVDRLRGLGLDPVLVTGDTSAAARTVADAVGIERVHAEVTPEGKLELVRRLQAEGRRPAMVGDGVNDAAALAAADLGIAMGGGTDAAAAASDLALLRDEPTAIADAIRLARATRATIRGNLFWAFAYNVAAIPLAAAGLLNPMVAGAAMAGSSVFVVLNSLRLRRD